MMQKIIEFFTWRCPCCGCFSFTVERRRRLTAYCRELDECNYLTSCEECYRIDTEQMTEQWDEYYRSR